MEGRASTNAKAPCGGSAGAAGVIGSTRLVKSFDEQPIFLVVLEQAAGSPVSNAGGSTSMSATDGRAFTRRRVTTATR